MKNRAAVAAGDAKRANREDLYQWKRTWYDELAKLYRSAYGVGDTGLWFGERYADTGRNDDASGFNPNSYRRGNTPARR